MDLGTACSIGFLFDSSTKLGKLSSLLTLIIQRKINATNCDDLASFPCFSLIHKNESRCQILGHKEID
jgi:hypothetical protein